MYRGRIEYRRPGKYRDPAGFGRQTGTGAALVQEGTVRSIRRTICEDAPAVVDRVLARWQAICDREPWWRMEHVDADHLNELVRATADAALRDDPDEGIARHFVATALAHGRDRRTDGHRDTVVHQEFLLLRRALRDDLKEQFGTTPVTHRAMTRLETALSHAEIASLHGFHELDLPAEAARNAPDRLSREWLRVMADWPPEDIGG
ncbi:MAG: hypothetical protein GWM90_29780 [Gemmatimonadetes bacterium]|nr:hypothetical protein [Gemmatimonadota bacterium]NIQ59271.1 hypothetical protein [Gemmatimonadota bacterium]NIU79458.1 hypothetical protein [Gammaproteobacteria bacterium]NIX48107.1 hypothetical protein [Gemmatimonadota bacterium]NIY12490.1 hypothetical protein [Gemmatimonadota bacterium]